MPKIQIRENLSVADFATELDDLITKHRQAGGDLDEMIADMSGAIDGLQAELDDEG